MKMKNFKRLFGFTRLVKPLTAFTLAEVLITLSILGVVAAITVPSLINKNTEKQTVAKVLKMYSTLSDAFAQAEAENGPVARWATNVTNFTDAFYKYLNVTKVCPGSAEVNPATECFTNTGIQLDKAENRRETPSRYGWQNSALLKDGTAITIRPYSYEAAGHLPGYSIFFDTNGKKEPNRLGKDLFVFTVIETGIVTYRPGADQNGCYTTSAKKPTGIYLNSDYNGFGCADYIVKNRNMNYLH